MPRQYHGNGGSGNGAPIVLNVAEKPSVARALQQVFGRLPGASSSPMERGQGGQQIFHHQGVTFPLIHAQGHGQRIQGPST